MYMKSPIHNCPTPDVLGRNNKANSEDRLMGVSNAADGPSKLCLLIFAFMEKEVILNLEKFSFPSEVLFSPVAGNTKKGYFTIVITACRVQQFDLPEVITFWFGNNNLHKNCQLGKFKSEVNLQQFYHTSYKHQHIPTF